METASSYRVTPSLHALFWFSLAAISILFVASFNFSAFSKFAVPMAELQRKVIAGGSDREVRAVVSSEPQGVQFRLVNLLSNQTVTRKIKIRKRSEQERIEQGLARARASIRKAALSSPSTTADEDNRSGIGIYRNPGAFYQSYREMERRLKVYVYREGEPPITHEGPCKDIYSIEGRFISEMEHGGSGGRFRTLDPERAHVYFMPFSVTWMVKYLYKPLSYDLTPLRQFVSDYVTVVSNKYPFWNSTRGAHHFMLACHDWGPLASKGHPQLYDTSIRVLCNANSSEGFNPQKDVSLPEIHLFGGNIPPKLASPPHTSPRPYLAFFAGGLHGPIRPVLLQHWKGRDPELPVYEYLPNTTRSSSGPKPSLDDNYYSFMLSSKYCLCPSGHEVASPRIVEAIYAGCVPVILSESYVLPFGDVLRWEVFSVRVEVGDIPRLKEVLEGIGEEEYGKLVRGVRAVRKHFMINQPAKRYDVFHMILHSVWLRRLNLRI